MFLYYKYRYDSASVLLQLQSSCAPNPFSNEANGTNGRTTEPAFEIKRIAIIGAGPSGLASAKHLLAEGFSSSQIDIYEQQAEVGGVWNYSAVPPPGPLRVPQTDAHVGLDLPVYVGESDEGPEEEEEEEYVLDSDEEACTAPGSGACSLPPVSKKNMMGTKKKCPPIFPSPMYDHLHTNIPHTLMRYSDLGFTADGKEEGTHKDCEIFPPRQVVQEYLMQYARDVRRLIRFSTQVTDVSLEPSSTSTSTSPTAQPNSARGQIRDQWNIRSTDLLTGSSRTEVYGAVVVASGHYSTPYIPATAPEISPFAAAHPGVISHAKAYRTASAFAGKRVMIVGTGPSGIDIASQISTVCASPLILSARSAVPEETGAYLGVGETVRVVGPITKFLVNERRVEVRSAPTTSRVSSESRGEEDENTERITDLDAIVFCTGYLYTFPFLSPSSLPPSAQPLITDGRRVHGLARHFIHVSHPTLVFPGLPIKVIPFPLAEAQAAVFSRLWANRLPLPSRDELASWEREDEEGKGFEGDRVSGPGKSFHIFPKGGDAKYINALHDWAVQTRDEDEKGRGKEPPFWGDEELWQRSIYAQAKMRFETTGRKARTLEELGFRHERLAQESKVTNAEKDTQLDIAG
ncbi:FAD/NAD(P)-binding domain-containing protein [Xylariaceae sp. FL1651]|nr:FAD/NAD(P)-binding domain-containing protein [Xylariaceae sp. FL1651]